MKNRVVNSNIIFRLAGVLLCLVLITSSITAGLFARYTSSASASDSARVASFKIETDLDGIGMGGGAAPTLELGGTDEVASVLLPFYIESESEVSVGYSVTVDFGEALPAYMSLTLSLKNGAKSQTVDANGAMSTFVFSELGTMQPGADEVQRVDLVLTIAISDVSLITEEVELPAAKLIVRVYQID